MIINDYVTGVCVYYVFYQYFLVYYFYLLKKKFYKIVCPVIPAGNLVWEKVMGH
jgi:hypothetical protein